jgi:hypothetical protein
MALEADSAVSKMARLTPCVVRCVCSVSGSYCCARQLLFLFKVNFQENNWYKYATVGEAAGTEKTIEPMSVFFGGVILFFSTNVQGF